MRVQTTLLEAILQVLDSQSADMHTAIPGIVRKYDAENQTADVEPALLRVVPAADSSEEEDPRERLPVLPAVPIAWPRAGGFFLHFPIDVGDSVLLVFCESDINAWRASGRVSDPGVFERHVLSGAVAVPGLYPRTNTNPSASGTNGRIGKEGGPFIEFRPSDIQVGGPYPLVRGDNIQAHLDAIAAALDSLVSIATAGGTVAEPNYGTAARALVEAAFSTQTTVTKGQ